MTQRLGDVRAAIGRGGRQPRLDRRPETRRPVVGHRYLRAARARLHDAAPGRARGPARHLRGARPSRRARTPHLSRRDDGGAAAGAPPRDRALAGETGLANFWGYNTLGFFAPHAGYSSAGSRGGQVREFAAMVRAMHDAGLEVVLDVVYNHTAEGGVDGPTLSLRGLDNHSYYRLRHGRLYEDYTGCGNTLDLRHPRTLALVTDSLRYWAQEMHVDGFRFDLAPALARGSDAFEASGTFLSVIGQDPVLSRVKLIAEPWDVGPGGYQLGRFPVPVDRVERPIPRHRAAVVAGRQRRYGQGRCSQTGQRHARLRLPRDRIVRRLRRRWSWTVGIGQLRHGARRVHPARPGDLRAQAQRGQRRGQP